MSTMPMQPNQRRGFGTAFDDILSGLPRFNVMDGINPQPEGGAMPTAGEMSATPKMSKGQMILGILGDALAGAAGRAPAFGQMMQQQKQQEREVAQWGLRRRAGIEDYEAKKKIDEQYKVPDVAPALRDARAWVMMTPEQRQAYQEMRQAGAGDPDVFVTLPNGQVYSGPKSGLSQALMGGAPAPQKPVGRLTPINGGPTPPASGGFRP